MAALAEPQRQLLALEVELMGVAPDTSMAQEQREVINACADKDIKDELDRAVEDAEVDVLLGVVKTIGKAPSGHHPAGKLVDDDDLAVFDDIVLVAFKHLVSA